MLKAQRLSHATFETPNFEKQIEHHVELLGLSVAVRSHDAVVLKTALGQPTLAFKRGAVARCVGVAFQVDPSLSTADMQKALAENGISAERRGDPAPGVSEMLRFDDPKGTTIEVFGEARFLEEDRAAKPIAPLKLGHLAFKAPDIPEMVTFYRDVLGFRVSDWRKDFFVWMRCGPDHHTVNFVRGAAVKMHHYAFELANRDEILRACDHLGRNRHTIIWGPGRHIIGDNVFMYHRDPDGHIVEHYAEMARIDSEALGYFAPRPWRDDKPYKPADWPAETLTNIWGAGPPAGFGD